MIINENAVSRDEKDLRFFGLFRTGPDRTGCPVRVGPGGWSDADFKDLISAIFDAIFSYFQGFS